MCSWVFTVWTFCLIFTRVFGEEIQPQLRVLANNELQKANSLLVEFGLSVEIQCSIPRDTSRGVEFLYLRKQTHGSVPRTIDIQRTNFTRLSYIRIVTLDDTGIYLCSFRSLTAITNIYVVKLVKRKNGTVATETTEEEIDSKILVRRTLRTTSTAVEDVDPNDQFMMCICQFAPSVQLEMVLVSWEGGLTDDLDNTTVYERSTWRHSSTNEIGSKLGLSTPNANVASPAPVDVGVRVFAKWQLPLELTGKWMPQRLLNVYDLEDIMGFSVLLDEKAVSTLTVLTFPLENMHHLRPLPLSHILV
ncbi:unnamed protein product [Dibothriocephalus latus]|uniref:Ig-like domain-containing protein n=1 Tax=Dibothriocephalus latus TaxID=60516 RepID=A0A3P6TYG8_DIBLA|nr:unnamed protein product [Dibothriocephalus latus]